MAMEYQIYCEYFVKLHRCCEPEKRGKYTLANGIVDQIVRLEEEEDDLNREISWFTDIHMCIKRKMLQIKSLEQWVDLHSYARPVPIIDSVQITNGFFQLKCPKDCYNRPIETQIRPDRKRYQKNLIKKGGMDVEYLEKVQDEFTTLKESSGISTCGTRELKDLVDSITHRIQHGNQKRAHEKEIYQEIKTANKTRELYDAQEPLEDYTRCYWKLGAEAYLKGNIYWKQSKQQEINICLSDIENLKSRLKERNYGVTRLKTILEVVRKDIKSLNKELENVTSGHIKFCKRSNKCGDQTEESIITYAERLGRKGDVKGLKRRCMRDTKVDTFVRQWCKSNGFTEDYAKKKGYYEYY